MDSVQQESLFHTYICTCVCVCACVCVRVMYYSMPVMRNALRVFQTAYVSDGSHACCSSFLLSEHVITFWLTTSVIQGRSPGAHGSVGCQIRVCLQDERQCLHWDTGSLCSEGVHQEGEWRLHWFENDWKISNPRFVSAAYCRLYPQNRVLVVLWHWRSRHR
jgi:hypothetical protein